MPLSANTMRARLAMIKPIITTRSLKTIRRGQNMIGELTEHRYRERVMVKKHSFENFEGAWVIPQDERRRGVILYLHGGGYACGGIEYASGFGSMLAERFGARVFCPAYRLAPEHPFPAAVDDCLEAYMYLLSKGYSADRIAICGESAGGGLCYSLCVKLRDMEMEMPCGIVAMSPWTDMTGTGTSYQSNAERDPSMTSELLQFFADCYVSNKREPLASPLFASLYGLPPSLIFVGADEIMLDDSVKLHEKLLSAHVDSRLHVAQDRWHGYLLYGLAEDKKDLAEFGKFLDTVMGPEEKLRWMPLDNAAKIYPAARTQEWSNVFRLSATLTEDVDVEILRSALDVTVRRFPAFAVRLRAGMFWYYLEQLSKAPEIMEEMSYPLTRMTNAETAKCAIRVIVYRSRIAVEIFHSITDGNGGLVFLKTLVAEYLHQRYGVQIPAEYGVLGRLEEPRDTEIEDSFPKYTADVAASRSERTAWHLDGHRNPSGELIITTFEMSVSEVKAKTKEYGVSINTFLCAAMMMALQNLQREQIESKKKRRPIKLLIPVNLRNIFESESLRNFALYTTPEIRPALGEYTFAEICKVITHHMGLDVTPKQMASKIATNVNSEKMMIVRVMPLFIKNFVMKAVFDTVGERKSCLTLSNLGAVKLPDVMKPYIERFDFILGTQATAPYNSGVISFGDKMFLNFTRNIRESYLELAFFEVLRDMGISVTVQSNTDAVESGNVSQNR
ncbi:MAG: alpha/beta hydrolase fold domain-containing protein [Clostridia bacterium]|nr:alpha/beta hydrolase fold domain-containing protein [Clostridia bacterium]